MTSVFKNMMPNPISTVYFTVQKSGKKSEYIDLVFHKRHLPKFIIKFNINREIFGKIDSFFYK